LKLAAGRIGFLLVPTNNVVSARLPIANFIVIMRVFLKPHCGRQKPR